MRAARCALLLVVASACRVLPVALADLPLDRPGAWIVIGGPDHPVLGEPGVWRIEHDGSRLALLAVVLEVLADEPDVEPRAFVEWELELVGEREAPGIGEERAALHSLLSDLAVEALPRHELLLRIGEREPGAPLCVIVSAGPPHLAAVLQLAPAQR